MPGGSAAQSVLGTVELELYISNFNAHEALGDLDSTQILIH